MSVSVCCGDEERIRPKDGKQVRFCGWRFPPLPAFSTSLRPRPWWPQARQGLGDTRTSAAVPYALPISHSPGHPGLPQRQTELEKEPSVCCSSFLSIFWAPWADGAHGQGGNGLGRGAVTQQVAPFTCLRLTRGMPGGCKTQGESFPRVTLQPGCGRGLWKRAVSPASGPGRGPTALRTHPGGSSEPTGLLFESRLWEPLFPD